MPTLTPRPRSLASLGIVLCAIACGAFLLPGARTRATQQIPRDPGVRAVYVAAEPKRNPPLGPAVTAALPQIEATEWAAEVDGPALARRVEEAARALSAEGFAIVSVTPILRGEARTQERQGAATQVGVGGVASVIGGFGTGWGAGYSVTDGVLIVGQRR